MKERVLLIIAICMLNKNKFIYLIFNYFRYKCIRFSLFTLMYSCRMQSSQIALLNFNSIGTQKYYHCPHFLYFYLHLDVKMIVCREDDLSLET